MGSSSADTIAGRASPARARASAAWISARRSPAMRMTSARLSGDGSFGGVACAAVCAGQSAAVTARRRTDLRFLNRFIVVTARPRVPITRRSLLVWVRSNAARRAVDQTERGRGT